MNKNVRCHNCPESLPMPPESHDDYQVVRQCRVLGRNIGAHSFCKVEGEK